MKCKALPNILLVLYSKFNKFNNTECYNYNILYMSLSYDVVSGSEIKPCNKIDKPLVVYRFTGKVNDDVHNNGAYIMTKL